MSPDRRSLARFLDRHRRGLSALLAGLAVVLLGMALRPPRAELVTVPVATSALAAGHRLTPEDVGVAEVPSGLAPASGVGRDPAELTGSVLAAPVEPGEPISAVRLLDPSIRAWATPSGSTPLPVRFADEGAVRLLEAGQRIDVLASQPATDLGGGIARASVVAADVLVLAVTRETESSDGGALKVGGDQSSSGSELVVLAVTPDEAVAVAGAEATARLTFTFTSPSS